jgi:hypothetical protein
MMPKKMAHRKKTEKGGWKYSSNPMMVRLCVEIGLAVINLLIVDVTD